MRKILLLWTLCAVFAQHDLFSQGKVNVDSLTAALNIYPKEDTVKVKMLLTLSKALRKTSRKDGINYIEKALTILDNVNHDELKADALRQKADYLRNTGKYDEAFIFASKSLEMYEQLRNIQKMAILHNLLAVIYTDKTDRENAKKQYEHSLLLCEQVGDMKTKMSSLNGLGILYTQLNDHKKAMSCYEQALELAQKNNDASAQSALLGTLGDMHDRLGNYAMAIDYLQKSLKINERIGNAYNLTYIYQNLGGVYLNLSEYEKALDYYKKSLLNAINTGNTLLEPVQYNRMAACYMYMKKYEEAIINIEKCIEIHKQLGNVAQANSALLTLGSIYNELGRKVDAYHCYQEALKATKASDDKSNTAVILLDIGIFYANEPDSLVTKVGGDLNERYDKALEFINQALDISTETNSIPVQAEALKQLSKIYESKKNYIEAYKSYQKYIALKDSISGDEVKKQITRKEIQYEFDKKETELKYQQQLTTDQLEKQKLLTFQREQALTLNKQTLTLKEQALMLSNKEKDLAHLAFLKEQAEKQEKEQELSLSQAREQGKELDLKLKSSELSAKEQQNRYLTSFAALQQKQKWYLGAVAVLLLLGLGILLYFYNMLKKQKNLIAQQNELNEQTITILSHDIKSPLIGVKLMLKKLNKDDPFVAQASQSLENQINAVNNILNNLLKMRKLALSKKDKNASANVNEIVQNVLQELSVAIQTKELNLQNELHEKVLLPIAPEKLQIILHNLLSNAVKYSFPHQSIRIFQEGKGICIQDFGVGLSPEQRSKLMREISDSKEGTNQERGNGLGLFIIGAMLQGEQIRVVFDAANTGGTLVRLLW